MWSQITHVAQILLRSKCIHSHQKEARMCKNGKSRRECYSQLKIHILSWCQWLTRVILAIWKAEITGSQFEANLGQRVGKTPFSK
jgi:hypothetical protein